MSEVINREVTEDQVVYTMEDGSSHSMPREFSERLGEAISSGMALLEAKGRSDDEAAAWIKQHVERIILRHEADDAAA
ncbi:hypothetical protein [Jannaschia rubra]|uniref:Uncharacterized protein n=1 Tax=Jannaschia rubra TaxID=282197 RepID=A0A0M6XLN8_9RHOB|nr:hypothetical protein [Jannaschia rubra]CTQ32066.1 hypothetical protein JAN5088_00827 [Jannaschia rubra]SFG38430.1 hypothetical protein SAMN04488517_104167 [Jannaschia rubra]